MRYFFAVLVLQKDPLSRNAACAVRNVPVVRKSETHVVFPLSPGSPITRAARPFPAWSAQGPACLCTDVRARPGQQGALLPVGVFQTHLLSV